MSDTLTSKTVAELVAQLRALHKSFARSHESWLKEAADEIERLDADAACEKAEKESLRLECATWERSCRESWAHEKRMAADRDGLRKDMARLLATSKTGGSDTCITCAAHVLVITEDLEPQIKRLRALLSMAEDCLPDGDYSVRVMAAKEIREALAGQASETDARQPVLTQKDVNFCERHQDAFRADEPCPKCTSDTS